MIHAETTGNQLHFLEFSFFVVSVETCRQIEGKKTSPTRWLYQFGLPLFSCMEWKTGLGGFTTVVELFGGWPSRAGTGPSQGHRGSGLFFMLCRPGRGPWSHTSQWAFHAVKKWADERGSPSFGIVMLSPRGPLRRETSLIGQD